jgi:hypothetical protein
MITPNQIAAEFNFNTHLLTTNTIPSQHDRNIIHHTLSSIDKDIFQAELDIAQLQKPLEKRTVDHAALTKRRASLAAVVSPLRQLPLEIFGQIFMYATLDDPSFPLSASHVCQLWHQASLASSDIWTNIQIGTNQFRKEYVELFIQRSRSRSVSLKCNENLPTESLPDLSTVLSEVGWDCRWKEVHVHPSWDNLPKILSKSWDTVESLILTSVDSRDSALDLKSATRLTHLSINHENSSKASRYKLPFSRLTHLHLNIQASPKTVISIMSKCRELEECMLTLRMARLNFAPKSSTQLPNLRKLHIRACQADELVKSLQTPAIEDLLLDFDGMEFESQDECLLEFIHASKSTLQKFSISMVSDNDLMEILEGMNRVNELRVIGNEGFRGDFLKALVVRGKKERDTVDDEDDEDKIEEASEIPLPNLEVLHVICTTYAHVRKAFLDVMRSRPLEVAAHDEAVARLKTACLYSMGDQPLAFVVTKNW